MYIIIIIIMWQLTHDVAAGPEDDSPMTVDAGPEDDSYITADT